MSKKSSRKGYSFKQHPKERREFIDYNYLDKLSKEELDWLGNFTDSYYGAGYKLSKIYAKLTELPPEFQELVKNNKIYKKYFVQIYGNTKKDQVNLDMRKMKSYPQYYLDENSELTTDTKYRFSPENVMNPLDRDSVNERVRTMRDDIFAHGLKETMSSQADVFDDTNGGKKTNKNHYKLDDQYSLSHEDWLLAMEEKAILDDIDGD